MCELYSSFSPKPMTGTRLAPLSMAMRTNPLRLFSTCRHPQNMRAGGKSCARLLLLMWAWLLEHEQALRGSKPHGKYKGHSSNEGLIMKQHTLHSLACVADSTGYLEVISHALRDESPVSGSAARWISAGQVQASRNVGYTLDPVLLLLRSYRCPPECPIMLILADDWFAQQATRMPTNRSTALLLSSRCTAMLPWLLA